MYQKAIYIFALYWLTLGLACSPTTNNNQGQLQLKANGEKLVTQGLIAKDDWQIKFDHVYVYLTNVTASQISYSQTTENNKDIANVLLVERQTVDLTKSTKPETTVLVNEIKAKSGYYNRLSWQLNPAKDGPITGYSLVLIGVATKAGETLPFQIRFDQAIAFKCGEYVGDEKKGILKANDIADMEITFHFDHLFGDQNLPKNDDLNQGALGFTPFANLAQNKLVNLNSQQLKNQLTLENWQKLQKILLNLGHVGEGHCQGEFLANKK